MKQEPCPFCGSSDIKPDNLIGRTRTVFRMKCQSCLAHTAFKDTQTEAEQAWNTRVQLGAKFPPAIINDDLFYFGGAVYARHPKTGSYYCNVAPEIAGTRGRRITKKLYLEALTNCKGGP
jgi:Lar family restriction alleviation protein